MTSNNSCNVLLCDMTAVDNLHAMIFTSLALIYEHTGQLFTDKVPSS